MDMMNDTRKATDFILAWMEKDNLTDAEAARLSRTDRGFIRDLRLGKPPRRTRRRETARRDMRYLRLARLLGEDAERFLAQVEREQDGPEAAAPQPVQVELPGDSTALDSDALADAIWKELQKRERVPGFAYAQLRRVLSKSWERPADAAAQVAHYLREESGEGTEEAFQRAVGWYPQASESPAWTRFWEECARVAFDVRELGTDRRAWVELFYLVARLPCPGR